MQSLECRCDWQRSMVSRSIASLGICDGDHLATVIFSDIFHFFWTFFHFFSDIFSFFLTFFIFVSETSPPDALGWILPWLARCAEPREKAMKFGQLVSANQRLFFAIDAIIFAIDAIIFAINRQMVQAINRKIIAKSLGWPWEEAICRSLGRNWSDCIH